MGVWEVAFVLEPSDHDARCDGETPGELVDLCLAATESCYEVAPASWWNEKVRGPLVCFPFLFVIGSGCAAGPLVQRAWLAFDEDLLLGVEENVGRFMEEAEPEMVVRAVTKAQRDDGLFR